MHIINKAIIHLTFLFNLRNVKRVYSIYILDIRVFKIAALQ